MANASLPVSSAKAASTSAVFSGVSIKPTVTLPSFSVSVNVTFSRMVRFTASADFSIAFASMDTFAMSKAEKRSAGIASPSSACNSATVIP